MQVLNVYYKTVNSDKTLLVLIVHIVCHLKCMVLLAFELGAAVRTGRGRAVGPLRWKGSGAHRAWSLHSFTPSHGAPFPSRWPALYGTFSISALYLPSSWLRTSLSSKEEENESQRETEEASHFTAVSRRSETGVKEGLHS